MRTAKFALAVLAALAAIGFAGSANASIIQIGTGANAYDGNIAIGDSANASTNPAIAGGFGIALGRNATVYQRGIAIGGDAQTNRGVSIGDLAYSNEAATAIGRGVSAGTMGSVAIGEGSATTGDGGFVAIKGIAGGYASIAIGGQALHLNSVALGDRSLTDRANQVSVGRPGEERQISNVAAATSSNDAVIYQQVVPAIQGIVSGLGGGATYNPATGVMTAPSYVLSMGTYDNVGDALAAIDSKPGTGGGESPYFKASGSGDTTPATASEPQSTAGGVGAAGTGEAATAYGYRANAGQEGTAIGAFAATNARCDAIGYASECDEDGTTSFGREGDESRLTRVAAGRNPTDAMNLSQGIAAAGALGGGAGYDQLGNFIAPTYNFISGATYNDVGLALADLDGRVNVLENNPPGTGSPGADGRSAYEVAVDNGFSGSESQWLESLKGADGAEGPQGPAGQDGRDGQDGRSAYEVAVEEGFVGSEAEWLESLKGADGRDGRDGGGSNAVAGRNIEVEDNGDGTQTVSLADNVELSDQGSVKVGATTVNARGVSIEGGPSMTTDGIDAGGKRVRSVADGRIERGSTDAVNGGQIWAMQEQWDDRWTEVNTRIDQTNDRLEALGAQSAAMAMMSGSSTHLPVGKVVVGAGVGFYGNKAAFAVGLKARTSERSSWSLGISISPDGKPMGGVGYSRVLD